LYFILSSSCVLSLTQTAFCYHNELIRLQWRQVHVKLRLLLLLFS